MLAFGHTVQIDLTRVGEGDIHLYKLILPQLLLIIEGWKPIIYTPYMSSLLGEKMGIIANGKASFVTSNI